MAASVVVAGASLAQTAPTPAIASAPAPAPSAVVPAKPLDDGYDGSLNVFISPAGEPFRGRITDPYASLKWFLGADRNGDGKIDREEFRADFAAFFARLDLNHDGVISSYELSVYEHRVAPEIIGVLYHARNTRRAPHDGAKLYLAQFGGGGGPGGGVGQMTQIDPGGGSPDTSTPKEKLDESHTGASFYSFFDVPEPVASADFNFNGLITRANFMRLAEIRFNALDTARRGYLTLETLPATGAQKAVEHDRRHKQKKK